MTIRRITVLATAGLLAVGMAACSKSTSGDAAPESATGPGNSQADRGVAAPYVGGETQVSRDPQSTFGLDVDTASYTYAARQIADGRWPDPQAIRPEEFVNAFEPNYPQPRGDGFAVHVDGAAMPPSHREASDEAGDLRLLRIGLATRAEDAESRNDAALTFVIDVSGSMAETGRLDLVQDALHTLVNELRPTDSVAIVAFNNRATVVREMTRVADAERLRTAIDSLTAGGSTNLEAGLVRGYQVARDGFRPNKTNRVILLSDGLANVGSTTAEPILRRVREEADKQIALLGVGVGSEYGDTLMERLADRGDGFVVYVANRTQARDVFVHRLPANLSVRALDAKAQVTFNESAVVAYRLVGYDDRQIADSDFRNDGIDGGEVGPGHTVTALYVVRLRPEIGGSMKVADVRARWLDPATKEANETYESVSVDDVSAGFATTDPHLRVAYAAAFFAEVLRSSRHGQGMDLRELLIIAEAANEQLRDRSVDGLISTMERAMALHR